MVDNFQAKYSALDIPYPSDQGTLAAIDAQGAEQKAAAAAFCAASKARIADLQAELVKREAMKPVEGTSGLTMPLIVVPIRPASRASSKFISSTGFIASHLTSSACRSAILALEAAQKAAAAAFCSAPWASMAAKVPSSTGFGMSRALYFAWKLSTMPGT